MSEDWQPGDLALCITNAYEIAEGDNPWHPKSGGLYEVHSFEICGTGDFLEFSDDPDKCNPEEGWEARDFRKIRPHTPDAEDAETIRLIKGEKVKA